MVVSHENDRYHSHLGQIVKPFEVVRALDLPEGGAVVQGLRFEAVHVFETPERKPEDEVTIVHFRSEDLHVAFLGDLGHSLDEAELAPIRGADVVLIPAGGPPTIDFPEIPALLDAIGPKIVVPMHYKTPKINLDIQPLETFLEVLPGDRVERIAASAFDVDRSDASGKSNDLCSRPRPLISRFAEFASETTSRRTAEGPGSCRRRGPSSGS